jgi:glycolate oxidase FAD binding subunit
VGAVGQAGNGVLHLALDGVDTADMLDRVLAPLRQEMAGEGGSVVVERAPLGVKRALDVWGPVGSDALAIMTRLKREFDPHDVLNPGRFVGGL